MQGSLFALAVLIAALISQLQCTAKQLYPPSHSGPCSSEEQLVMCGAVPFLAPEWRACCAMYAQKAVHISSVLQIDTGTHSNSSSNSSSNEDSNSTIPLPPPFPSVLRLDLLAAPRFNISACSCLNFLVAHVPAFNSSNQDTDDLNQMYQIVPALTKQTIERVKAEALLQAAAAAAAAAEAAGAQKPVFSTVQVPFSGVGGSSNSSNSSIWSDITWSRLDAVSGFRHPGTCAGPAELAFMLQQLHNGSEPQASALHSLLTGVRVPPKVMDLVSGWSPPTDCSPDNYTGPYPMQTTLIRYGGLNDPSQGQCALNYPPGAPPHICGHVGFVELDGQMSFKQAVAFWATGDVRHGRTALRIMSGWAAVNKVFGPAMDGNGPLEAAWGCASMSRAMELLRSHPDWQQFGSEEAFKQFVDWVGSTLLPPTDAWVAFKTPLPHWGHDGNVYANWHASIAECWMAFGILSDDRARYSKAVQLFHDTVGGTFKWGRGAWAANRLIGEGTETLRDIYHTLFGLGSLLQTAEMAWQQDDDLYSSNGHVLAAALEVHARIVNAGTDEALLPPNFRLFESMPAPPEGCAWRMNLGTQLWMAVNITTGARVSDLTDGLKYVLGSKYLPTGFEVGFNHYAGRLGMSMPETAALLQANPVEYYVFHWGLGSLTHAGSAALLWQPGVTVDALCPQPPGASANSSTAGGDTSAGGSTSPDPAVGGSTEAAEHGALP
ncbi:chondroitin AC/alginate lyase [Scenedesmus sp. NREL 46B-D3]|nr:chondroitin AC/alginate lyase [Scenedesmus sp. NREL 46B-D3]